MSCGFLARSHESGLELVLGHAGLLSPDVLHVEAKDAGDLGQVIGVAASRNQAEHVARANGARLPRVEVVLAHVGLFVRLEGIALVGRVEGKAHLVEGVAFSGLLAIKGRGAWNLG